MKFKVWVHIEEIDEEADHYQDLPDELIIVGEYDTLEEAQLTAQSLS